MKRRATSSIICTTLSSARCCGSLYDRAELVFMMQIGAQLSQRGEPGFGLRQQLL
jgi:hypothetical protein